MPIVADAAVRVAADMKPFENDLRMGGDRATRTLGDQLKSVFSPRNLAVAGVAGGIAIAGAITAGLGEAVRSLIDIERLNAQTDAVLRSTGGVANVTREQIEAAAEAAEQATTIQRETVQEAQNMLLTFTNVRDEVGEGNDIFTQATDAVLDMSVAMGTDAQGAALQLGKALNDPIKGMAQLGRAGVQFTDEQKEMVEALVATGDLLGAQKIILAELETQFGGSAEAFANTTAGKIQRFQNDVGNMFESIILGAVTVADVFGNVAESAGNGFEAIGDFLGTEILTWDDIFGEGVDAAETELNRLPDAAMVAAARATEGVYTEMAAGGKVVAEEAGKIAGMLPSEIQARVDEIREAGRNQVVEFAAGMIDKQNDPLLAMEALARANETVLTRGEEIARLKGQLTSTELANGLNDTRVEVRLAAEAARGVIIDRLERLGVDASTWGYNIGKEMAGGIDLSLPVVRTSAGGLANAVRGQIGIRSEPDDHSSPLYGHMQWGRNLVKDVAEGMLDELSTGSSAARAVAGALVPNLAAGQAGLAALGGGGQIIQYILNVEGHPIVMSDRPEDVLDRWAQETSLSQKGVT